MTVLFGHPTGNPNSHHAALAHFEAGQLEAFCTPWMPSAATLSLLEDGPWLNGVARRLARRHFPPLAAAPKIQGCAGEWLRLLIRTCGGGDERLSYAANDWLMETMAREVIRPRVTAVHAYEDCSLRQFQAGKRQGKACIYDMPIGYYGAWQEPEANLYRTYADWLPDSFDRSLPARRVDQKREEVALADLVLVPSDFVARTLEFAETDAKIAVAPYGVDAAEWYPAPAGEQVRRETIDFLFVGQCSMRKGVPLLLDAWRAAGLKGARLHLVGTWNLADGKRSELPPNVTWTGALPKAQLRERYQQADALVFPTFFEGRALAVAEAMACGLPVLTTPASGLEDIIDASCGRMIPIGDQEALVEGLRWLAGSRDKLPAMGDAARIKARASHWSKYRRMVREATDPFCSGL